jgi:hypothetical protein
MATMDLPRDYVTSSLEDLQKRLNRALKWARQGDETIPLRISTPFDHPVREHKPQNPTPCGVPPILEDCSEIGILMGVLEEMPRPHSPRRRPKAAAKQGSRT